MRDQTINSSPNVSISSPQVEPLIVGNANGIIRFLGTLSLCSTGWFGFLGWYGNWSSEKSSPIPGRYCH